MSKRPVPFWLIALAVFFLFLCSYLIAPGFASELEAPPRAVVLQEFSSLAEDPAEGGLPSDASESTQEAPEATSVDDAPAEGGLPSDVSESTQEATEATSVDDAPAEGGLPSAPALLNFADYVALQSDDSAEGGLPSDASESTQEAPEATSVDDAPAEGGLSSDGSGSTQEAPEDTSVDEDPAEGGEPECSVATDADLKALSQSVENVHADLWLLLFTFWGFAGVFLGYKVGGVVLGRL